jgi:hypothetical protein
VVVLMGYILPTKNAHGGIFLHLLRTVRTVAAFAVMLVVGLFVQVDFRNFPGFAVQLVLDGGMQGISPQVGTVELVGGQTAQSLGHIRIGNLHGLRQGFALGHFGDHAGNRDGGAAAEGFELDVDDAVILDLDVHIHHIPAHRVANFAHPIGVDNFAHIARILKVIQYYWGICHVLLPFK